MFIVGVGLVSVLSAASDVLTERTHFTAQRLLLRLVAAFFAANFASVAAQCRGLIGPDGILPLDRWFGTPHDGSEEAQQRLRKRLREKGSEGKK